MEAAKSIESDLSSLIDDFVNETAYQQLHLLSQTSQNLCFQMQSDLVNAHHIWGDAVTSTDPAVRRLSISISVKNLETFVEAVTAAQELHLILPNHLIDYQDRAQKIIQAMKNLEAPNQPPPADQPAA